MNTRILNQYGLQFRKISNGSYNIKSIIYNHINLGIFIDGICYKGEIFYLLENVNKALNNQFNLIDVEDWMIDEGDIFIGSINNDMTFTVSWEEEPNVDENYPLSDIKEILESLIEFIQS